MTIQEFVLTASTYYSDDPIEAGLQIAFLKEKKKWYVCLHRFPSHQVSKREYVAKALGDTLDEAVDICFNIWRQVVDATLAAKAVAASGDMRQ